MATHEITNQPPPLPSLNLYASDPALVGLVHAFGGAGAEAGLAASGRGAGDEETQALARQANRHGPELVAFDRFGRRQDLVEFHPAYHALMTRVFAAGAHSASWTAGPAGHVVGAATAYLWTQADAGVMCPASMTGASLVVLRREAALRAALEGGILSPVYDPRPLPFDRKAGLTVGMAMTEKQGGSDLRAVATRAVPAGEGALGPEFLLTGHKWFCSAPMSDAFLTLARTEAGVTCLLVLRSLADGTRNTFSIQRLKDKVGNRSNASAEIEYDGTRAVLVGEPGRGIATLIEMAHRTRLDAAVGSAATVRRALVEVVHHARHRTVFQRRLVDQPLMMAVLAELAVESEALLALCLRAAASCDAAAGEAREAALSRLLVPLAKFWVCKRAPVLVAEAMECLGGNGYVEDGVMGRLYREAPLNGIWEGPANVMCLDMLRAFERDGSLRGVVLDEIGFDRERLGAAIDAARGDEGAARRMAEALAVSLAAALLERHAPGEVASLFRAARLDDAGAVLGRAGGRQAGGRQAGGRQARAVLQRTLAD